MSVEQLCGGQCTEETISLVRKQLLQKQSALLTQKENIEAEIRRLTNRLQLAMKNLKKLNVN
ncbi:hypothetical protein P9D34_05910 [Bacillus swezeyi]|uniref:hypothetical protein n=1 Tax=Bacillus swezeyi TaxID=1925020 RepID=UPI001EFB9238|nr:hypothetical protein [Bacillus swezeyi]MEC1259988.1 hypothetical protein [Bacillus swezeyi]MED2929780.1 hypothetical protein [Bacillus swezeyi]MED2963193.1 hypothetical protein [Bacillus swezeyi]MED3073144.1 hypothetical protein [Bacillus swezeyi]MED3082777.1 hypothetical protein [Bacillus swezeyi]